MRKYPNSVTLVLLFLLLNALVWFAFTALVALDLHPALPESSAVRWVMGMLAFGCACTLIVLMALLRRHIRIAYYFTIGLLVLPAVLTITDEVGWTDWIYLILVLMPLALLIKDRSWYLRKTGAAGKT